MGGDNVSKSDDVILVGSLCAIALKTGEYTFRRFRKAMLRPRLVYSRHQYLFLKADLVALKIL